MQAVTAAKQQQEQNDSQTDTNVAKDSAITTRARPAHLWQPGQSGNPSGRPKKPLSDRLLARLMKEDAATADAIVNALLIRAQEGGEKTANASVKALTEIFDRVEGKVAQAITGGDGGPLAIQIEIQHIGAPASKVIEVEAVSSTTTETD